MKYPSHSEYLNEKFNNFYKKMIWFPFIYIFAQFNYVRNYVHRDY